MSDEKAATVKAEVQRLLDVKVIREVKYPTWLANTVLLKKKNGKGIETNHDEIRALKEMEEPVSVRDVQKLTGRITALSKFIPRSAECQQI